MKKLILFLAILSVIQVSATVKQLGKIKLKETVVTAIQSDNETIIVDAESNLSTNYRGIVPTNFVITAEGSNDYYRCVKGELDDVYSIDIYCHARVSARYETSLDLSNVAIYPPTDNVAGVRQSFIEFDCLSTNKFSVQYAPSISLGMNKSFSRDNVSGSSTNLITILGITDTQFIADSVSTVPLN